MTNLILVLTLSFCITSGTIVDKDIQFGGKRWEQTGWVYAEEKAIPWYGNVYYPNRYYLTVTKYGLRQRLNVSQNEYRRYEIGDYFDYYRERVGTHEHRYHSETGRR